MRYRALLLMVFLTPPSWAEEAVSLKSCASGYSAKLVSLQGSLFFDPESKGQWQPAELNQQICEGSRIRTENYSRASIALPNGIILKLDQNTVISLNGFAPQKKTLMDMARGFVHFISRTPTQLQITTPIANAGPEGTEFALSVDDKKASLWVYEGGVKFFNAKGELHLKPGESAITQLGQAPRSQIDLRPQDAVNWALYYPPILPYPAASTVIDSQIRSAIDQFRTGHIDIALASLDSVGPEKHNANFYKIRAAMRLTIGRIELAKQDINALQIIKPNDAEALALRAIMALTQNRKDEALQLAQLAIASDPQSASAYSALSFVEQAGFNLDKAQATADQATKLAPHDAMVWARKAELELSHGATSASKQTALRAAALDPNLERTQTITGFAYLLRMDTDEALQAFNKAITLDSSSPLARLGLGLAKIRNGDLKEGRQDLEIAAILDPNNSLIRSYLGKAYYEEKRNRLAEDQFGLAKLQDAKDPTPWFYDAIKKQTENRPVEALQNMQKAIELNDNRAVSRSKLFLDEDTAAKSANLARIYNDLDFGRIALVESWKALSHDTTNPSAHRFLSDAYIGQPRFRVARASELLQAQLLQPINITPVQPQLTSENTGILNSTGPGSLSMNEYDPLYNRDGAHIVLNGAYGSNNTITNNAIISNVYKKLSTSLGQFHYQTDGFRKNDDYKQDIYDAYAQYAINPNLNFQFELKTEDIRSGDMPLRLNSFNQDNLRQAIEQDMVRVGSHYKIDVSQNVLFSAIYSTRKDQIKNTFSDPDFADQNQQQAIFTSDKSYQFEIQHIYKPNKFELQTGLGYSTINTNNEFTTVPQLLNPPKPPKTLVDKSEVTKNQNKLDYISGYMYLKHPIARHIKSTLGISVDYINTDNNNQKVSGDKIEISQSATKANTLHLNPKFGIMWDPFNNLTLRTAVFRTYKHPLITNQTIEPTQIAGFNQFYDEPNASSAWQYSFGVNYNPIRSVFVGGEMNWRCTKQPDLSKYTNKIQDENIFSNLAFLYWYPAEWMSGKVEYKYEKTSRDYQKNQGDFTYPKSLVTHQLPISLNFYNTTGIFAKIQGVYVNQQIALVRNLENTLDMTPLTHDSESFWLFDATLGFRLPKKTGVISLEMRNIFNNKFRYQSSFDENSGPQQTMYVPERQIFAKVSLFY